MNSPADIYLCIPGPDAQATCGGLGRRDSSITTPTSLYHSTEFVVPRAEILVGGTNDVIDIEDITSTQTASLRVLCFTRLLNTGDALDTVIAPGVMPLTFTYWDVPLLGYHGLASRTQASVDFFKGDGQVTILLETGPGLAQLDVLHGITMILAFEVFYPSGIFIAFKRIRNTENTTITQQIRLKIIVSAVTAVAGTYGDLSCPYSSISITVGSLTIVSTVAGLVVAKARTRFPLKWSKRLRKLHRFSGYCGYSMGVANGFIGVLDITGNDWSLAYAYAGFVVALVIGLSVVFLSKRTQVFKTGEDESTWSFVGHAEHSPMFNWQEIELRVHTGAKWIVIENSECEYSIISLACWFLYEGSSTLFIDWRPGGPDLILSHIGEDVTRFFPGGESGSQTLATCAIDDVGESADRTIYRDPRDERRLRIRPPAVEANDRARPDRVPLAVHRDAEEPLGQERSPARVEDSAGVRKSDGLRYRSPWGQRSTHSVNTGSMDLIVKMINGPMTSHLLTCATIAVRGPQRRMMCLNARSTTGSWNKIGMIARGTGVTPILLAIDYHIRNTPQTSSGDFAVELSLLHVFCMEDERFAVELLNSLEKEARGALKVHRLIADGNTRKITTDDIISMMPFEPSSLLNLPNLERRKSGERRPSLRNSLSERQS
ncbi:hypothetical protein BDK51DRAFT_37645 [Blyttiomyces helicus]|uniref:Uncharacterized protein n=1 Tax=Blyttiomyces helicus TaxID=388810 RepID=A0A4P9WHS9_9FUNG|nr:hypothetical protein BDK51DRAFT_37645 [Blyttiomyces helicus]|eukprot:RKO91515.1 hypothetical protein BDK51DRAFT_37645 [Blyttiomyces helicus]